MFASWMKWAVAEGATKAAQRMCYKLVGTVGRSINGAILVIFISGLCQFFGGLVGARVRNASLWVPTRQIVGCLIFGLLSAIMMCIGVVVFTFPGADAGVITFLVTLSIIPGAIIDAMFFGHPLRYRQWLGVGLFLLAGCCMLNFPSLSVFSNLPPWFWLALVSAFLAAVNEGVANFLGKIDVEHHVPKLDPFVKNFWDGLAIITSCGLGVALLGAWRIATTATELFWMGTLLLGFLSIGSVAFKLISYQKGGSIALKKVIMQSSHLILATLLGAGLYGESLTTGKCLGISGYIVAFAIMDQPTWETVSSIFRRKSPIVS